MLCAGGGILLSTIFLHMLPAVRVSIKVVVKKGVLSEETVEKYHLGELLICTGQTIIKLEYLKFVGWIYTRFRQELKV